MTNLSQKLRGLEETIRLLTLENDRLSQRATELELLGQLAARTEQARDPETLLQEGLEQISFLMDVPLCLAWQDEPGKGRAVLRHAYSTFEKAPAPGTTAELSEAEAQRLLLLTGETASNLLVRLAESGFAVRAALRVSLPTSPGFEGFLMFADDRADHRLHELTPLLGWAADLIGIRHLNLRLHQALEQSNRELEARVADRTHTLREAYQQLQAEMAERQKSDLALRESEQRFRLLAEASFEGIGVTRDGVFVDANDQLARMLGWSRRELLGRSVLEVVAPESRDEVQAAIRANREAAYEHLALRKDGTIFPVEIRARSLRLQGEILRLTAVRDISDRRRSEEERRQLEAALQQTQRLESLGVLAGGIAHDFNNLLTGVLGNAGLAAADVPTASPALEPLHEISVAARRAADLCRQLLAYSGRGHMTIRPLDLRVILRETLDLLRLSLDKKTLFQCQLPEALPAMDGDATQIRQVLMNLAINASESLEGREGSVRISIREVAVSEPPAPSSTRFGTLAVGPHVCLEVTDTGCGMDAPTRSRIFEPFFSTKFTGRGLGLSAVLGIVRSHQGSIEVESEPGRGTCFRLWFPVSHHKAPLASTSPADQAVQASGHVLLVDDEDTVRRLGRRVLERAGFRVSTASDGLEALELFRTNPGDFDCVVLDLTMPRMDGAEALAALHQLRPELPVLLASGYTEHELSARFKDQTVSGFIEKPYEVETLVHLVCEVVRQRRSAVIAGS